MPYRHDIIRFRVRILKTHHVAREQRSGSRVTWRRMLRQQASHRSAWSVFPVRPVFRGQNAFSRPCRRLAGWACACLPRRDRHAAAAANAPSVGRCPLRVIRDAPRRLPGPVSGAPASNRQCRRHGPLRGRPYHAVMGPDVLSGNFMSTSPVEFPCASCDSLWPIKGSPKVTGLQSSYYSTSLLNIKRYGAAQWRPLP